MRFVVILDQLCEIATSHNIRSPVYYYHCLQNGANFRILTILQKCTCTELNLGRAVNTSSNIENMIGSQEDDR